MIFSHFERAESQQSQIRPCPPRGEHTWVQVTESHLRTKRAIGGGEWNRPYVWVIQVLFKAEDIVWGRVGGLGGY